MILLTFQFYIFSFLPCHCWSPSTVVLGVRPVVCRPYNDLCVILDLCFLFRQGTEPPLVLSANLFPCGPNLGSKSVREGPKYHGVIDDW